MVSSLKPPDNPQIQSHSSQETRRENHETSEKKKFREEEVKTINLFTNIPEIPLLEVILRNSCHGLSPLDIMSLDTNVKKNHFQRHYKSYRVGWLLPILFTVHHQRLYLLSIESPLV